MEAVPASHLGEVHSMVLQVCVIGIDEGQFVSTFLSSRPLVLTSRENVHLVEKHFFTFN